MMAAGGSNRNVMPKEIIENTASDPIQYVNTERNLYINAPSSRKNNTNQQSYDEVIAVGDEGISDCSPGASERDSSSPAPRSVPENKRSLSPTKYNMQSDMTTVTMPCADSTRTSDMHEKELSQLRLEIAKHKVDLERAIDHIHYLEEVNLQQGLARAELEAKHQTLVQRFEITNREKEAMVMRYAVSEKNVIEQKNTKETVEKQLREANKEIELFNNKVSLLNSEKSRICQMFDNKCHELSTVQRELEKSKNSVTNFENNVKSLKSLLKNECESRKELQITIDSLNSRLQLANQQIENAKREAQESIRAFRDSQENKAFLLDKQLKESTANLILARHECSDREQRSHALQNDLDNLHQKYEKIIQENNELSMKVQQLEQDRLENEKRITDLREIKNKENEQISKVIELETQLEELKMKLSNKEDKFALLESQIEQLKTQNSELQTDLEARVHREEEMLKFTQILTEKNVRLQSEYTSLETKVQQLQCEQETVRRSSKDMQSRLTQISHQLDDEKQGRNGENVILTRHLAEKTQEIEKLKRDLDYQQGEYQVLKRKYETQLKQMTKELHQCHKKIETLECANEISKSNKVTKNPDTYLEHQSIKLDAVSLSNSDSSPSKSNTGNSSPKSTLLTSIPLTNESETSTVNSPVVDHPVELDKNALMAHVMRLQRISARKSEKLDFLESHVQTLVGELQKKSRLLQDYMMREQTGALTSNAMDKHKAEVAKSKGVMASMFNSRVSDNNLTLELSLDINRRLQAVLEDTMLKNITLKESVDTLGKEIERLKSETKLEVIV